MTVSGLTAIPVSTAQVTLRSFTSPSSSISASTTVAMKLANDGCTLTPRPTRSGNGSPQLDFSAARFSAASRRGFLPSMPRRKSTGSLPAFFASSSMKDSMAKTLLLGPTPRQKPVGTAGGSARANSTWKFGMSYGMSMALSTPSMSTPFWKPAGNQRAMMDEPLTRYFQPTILPSDSVAAMVAR